MSHESPYVPPVGSNPNPTQLPFRQVKNVKIDYGATGGGSLDDAQAFRNAGADIITAGGGDLYLPTGTYSVARDHSNPYSVGFVGLKNAVISGVRGTTWLRHPTGMPNNSVAVLKLENCDNVIIRDLGFDGNWGNAATTIAEASHNAAIGSTINVIDTTDFPTSGTIQVQTSAGMQPVTYTGKTSTSFTGCTGGTGTLVRGYAVGYVNGNGGINHTSQVDPKNYLLFLPGSSNITIQNCQFRQAYGDFIWTGASGLNHASWSRNIRIVDCDMDMSARHGITFGSGVSGVTIERCRMTNVGGNPIFEQTNQYPVRDIAVSHCSLAGWWDPAHNQGASGGGNAVFGCDNVAGGASTFGAALRNWRITDNVLMGGASFGSVWDFVYERNHVVMDWNTPGVACIKLQFGGGDIRINRNWMYSRCALTNGHVDGAGDSACIVLLNTSALNDGAGNAIEFPPTSAQIDGNVIHARNGRDGVLLAAAGGTVTRTTGTASAAGLLTVTDSGASWTVNQWAGGYTVRIGNAIASIFSNTATTLTLDNIDNSTGTAWQTFHGEYAATPAPGSYVVSRTIGFCDVRNNEIDCGDDGNGPGGVGVWVTQSSGYNGTRARVVDNKIRNANGVAVYVQWHTATTMRFLEIRDNVGSDNQPTPTMIATVGYSTIPNVAKWIQRGNINDEGVVMPVCNRMALSMSAATNNCAHTGHNCITGQGPLYLTNIVGCGGLTTNTPYWIIQNGANNFRLATSQAGALVPTAIDITTDGSATGFIVGPTFSVWLEEDGAVQRWAGIGSPEGAVTAVPGATYKRLDGAAGTFQPDQYHKISGSGNTGWRAVWGGTETKTSGALTPAMLVSMMTTANTVAYTLADGDATLDGMVKKFLVTSVSGSPAGTLTPTHLADGSTHTITWSAVCSFELMWDNANTTWRVVGTPRNATVN